MAWEGYFIWKLGETEVKDSVLRYDYQNEDYPQNDLGRDWSLSDYIMEAHTVRLLISYNNWLESDKPEDISRRTLQLNRIRNTLCKILDNDINIQMYIDVARGDVRDIENVRRKTIDEQNAERLCELLQRLQEYIDEFERGTQPLGNDYGLREDIQSEAVNYQGQVSSILVDIGNWINRIDTMQNITPHEMRTIKADIEKLVDRIPKSLSNDSKERYKLLKKLSKAYYPEANNINFDLQMMSISKTRFDEKADDILENIVLKMQMMQGNGISFEEILYETCDEKLHDIEKCLNQLSKRTDKSVKDVIKKYDDKPSCFGIMETPDQKFFALSSKDDYEGVKWQTALTTSHEIMFIAEVIGREVFNDEYSWAKMTDETRRYTELVIDNKRIVSIDAYSTLGNDFGKIKDINVIGKTYGCCERKMQACNGHEFTSAKRFYARWAPCPKCVPALAMEKGNIRIFAIAENFKEWKQDYKGKGQLPLQEYAIKPNLYRLS